MTEDNEGRSAPSLLAQDSGRLSKRFFAAVDASGDCWEWTNNLTPSGYGKLKVRQRSRAAHRVSYELLVGPIPPGLQLDHLCRNRACVNPDHLEPVTPQTNSLRGATWASRNAAKTSCPQGHVFTAANTYTNPAGSRCCRTCRNARKRAARARKKAMS